MLRATFFLAVTALGGLAPVQAQKISEGDWVGRIIHLTGRYMDTVYKVRHENGNVRITMEVQEYGPFEFENIRVTGDSLSFSWEPSFAMECTLYRLPDSVYQGACIDPWGGFGGIIMAPPGFEVDAIELHNETIESIAGWTPAPKPEEWPDLGRDYPKGKTALVGERRVNYVDVGTGAVTVVLEAGMGDHLASWEALHKRLATTFRVVAYDRAGLGLSSASSMERSPEQLATELRGLLREAGIPPPYLLLAHAESAFSARRFANLFREDMIGLVLIDPHLESQATMWRGVSETSWNEYWSKRKAFNAILPVAVRTEFSAYAEIIESGYVPGLNPVPSVPTIVLSAGRASPAAVWTGESVLGRSVWTALHESWVESMPHGTHVAFPASGTYIHQEDPDGVARLVQLLAEGAH